MMYLKTITITTIILAGLSPILSEFLLDNPLRYCEEKGDCIELPEKEILERYGNMFYTEEQIEEKIHKLAMRNKMEFGPKDSRLCGRYRSSEERKLCKRATYQDFDLCCPSEIMHTYNYTMVNVHNVRRSLIRFINPGRWQFIPSAKCSQTKKCSNGNGTCRLHPISIWLLVFYEQFHRLHITYEEFEIPGYCSCKRN